jgi:O6-methylguanine-DNA--protein-cysteine methyltransferase
MNCMKRENVRTEKDVGEFLKEYSEFERAVYLAAFKIPKGKVSTYGRVANALHNNPLFPIVPCHRVVQSNGGFGGEPRAAAGRRRRCEEEGVPTRKGKVVITDDILF